MLYFKKIKIATYSCDQIEKSLRRSALKRRSPLDLASSVSDIGTDKLFVGYEDKKGLTFSRLRSSVEKFLPKLILRLSNEEQCAYKIRFAAPAAMFFVFVACGFMINLFVFFVGNTTIESFLIFTIFAAIYFFLILFEIRLTTSRVNKALGRLNE